MNYWVVMYDRDGGESGPVGPFADGHDAQDYAISELDDWRWVHYEIQGEDG